MTPALSASSRAPTIISCSASRASAPALPSCRRASASRSRWAPGSRTSLRPSTPIRRKAKRCSNQRFAPWVTRSTPEVRGARSVSLSASSRKISCAMIALDELGCPVTRVSVPAAARGVDRKRIARLEQVTFALREMLRHGFLVALPQADRVGSARISAEEPRRAVAAVLHEKGRLSLAAQHFHAIAHAKAATESAGAARALAQRILLEQQRIALLQHLDRLRLRDADGPAAVAEPVTRPPAAITAA